MILALGENEEYLGISTGLDGMTEVCLIDLFLLRIRGAGSYMRVLTSRRRVYFTTASTSCSLTHFAVVPKQFAEGMIILF